MQKDALDLINRQKAEIDDLDRNLMSAYSKIERLKKGWEADIVLTADARAEAIKEFAERLKKRLDRKYTIYGREYVLRHLRDLVKEMTEEKTNGKL